MPSPGRRLVELCLVAASHRRWTARRAALFWLLAVAGIDLFATDMFDDCGMAPGVTAPTG